MNVLDYVLQIGVSVIISAILVYLLSWTIDKLKDRQNRVLNPTEYFPEEEIQTLKQVYYLILVLLIVMSITNFFFDNDIIFSNSPEYYVFHSILDIVLSIYIITIRYREDFNRNKIVILFMLPIASIAYLIFGGSYIEYWDFMRIPVMLYVIKQV